MFRSALIRSLPLELRRVMSRKEAASYLGVSPGYFDKLVRLGHLPGPLSFPGVKRWDKEALDQRLNFDAGVASTGEVHSQTAYDTWSRCRGAN